MERERMEAKAVEKDHKQKDKILLTQEDKNPDKMTKSSFSSIKFYEKRHSIGRN